MGSRKVVAALAAAGSIALLWAPYFRSFAGPIHLADVGVPGFAALWLGRAGIALIVVAAVLTFVRQARAATAVSAVAVLATLLAGTVSTRLGSSHSITCAGWVYYNVPKDPCGPIGFASTSTWGWGLALLLAVAAATAPMWSPATALLTRRAGIVAAVVLTVATLLVASFAPVFQIPRTFPRRYADYLLVGPLPKVNAWHGGFAPAGIGLLVLAALLIVARHSSAVMVAALAVAALAVAGVDRPTFPFTASLGWGYWAMLAGAIAVLVLTLLSRVPRLPRFTRLVSAPV